MKYTIIQKIGLCILGLIFITFFVKYLVQCAIQLRLKRKPKVVPLDPEEARHIDKYGNVKEGIDPIQLAIDEVIIANEVMEEGSILGNLATTIVGFIVMIGIYTAVIEALVHLRVGILQHVICGMTEFSSGFDNSITTIGILANCSWDKFVKFWNGTCTKYYLADMTFGLLYGILVELPCVLVYAITGIDLQPLVQMVFNVVILPMDNMIYSICGYHITKWTDSVITNCYRCQGTYEFEGQSITLTKSFNEWAKTFKCSGQQMAHGITKIFQSIVPSAKWNAWVQGRHLDGADDNPSF